MERLAVFAYGSLVDPASAGLTLGRNVERVWPARLRGRRRRFSQARDNLGSEKMFARVDDGSIPEWVLGLNLEPSENPAQAPNGALLELTPAELDRLDLREIRYDRVEVTASVEAGDGAPSFDRVLTYVAKAANFAPEPPAGAVILTSYAEAVEAAFARLGPGQQTEYEHTTLPYPVELVAGRLVRDEIPAGNPRAW